MKFALGLLIFIGATTLLAGQSTDDQSKPAIIEDGQPAQNYINAALYEYLEKPPYLAIGAETPFFPKTISGQNVWIALVEFYTGDNEQHRVHCVTVIVYDPSTSEHRFMKPDEIVQAGDGDAI